MTTRSTRPHISNGAGRIAKGSGRTSSKKVWEREGEVFVRYKCITNDGKEFRNAEFFTFGGDKVRSVEVYFGPTYEGGVFVRDE